MEREDPEEPDRILDKIENDEKLRQRSENWTD